MSFQYLPDSIACRLYILTDLVETTIDLAVEGDLLLRVHEAGDGDDSNTDQISGLAVKMPVYLGIFALAQYVYPALYPFPFLLLHVLQCIPILHGH